MELTSKHHMFLWFFLFLSLVVPACLWAWLDSADSVDSGRMNTIYTMFQITTQIELKCHLDCIFSF